MGASGAIVSSCFFFARLLAIQLSVPFPHRRLFEAFAGRILHQKAKQLRHPGALRELRAGGQTVQGQPSLFIVKVMVFGELPGILYPYFPPCYSGGARVDPRL